MEHIYAKLRTIFHDVFDDDTLAVEPDLQASEIPAWDSLGHIRLILSVQKAFKIRFSAAEIAEMNSVKDLAEFVRAKTR
jgi:acyl carrier protein